MTRRRYVAHGVFWNRTLLWVAGKRRATSGVAAVAAGGWRGALGARELRLYLNGELIEAFLFCFCKGVKSLPFTKIDQSVLF